MSYPTITVSMSSFRLAKSLSFFLVLTLLSTLHVTHARDSRFFNKLPAGTNTDAVPIAEPPLSDQPEPEPSFVPENDNVYGLYGQESTTTDAQPAISDSTVPLDAESRRPLSKYLPKNYNPVAYVTVPEETLDSTTFTEDQKFSNNKYDSYVNNQQDKESADTRYHTSTNVNQNNYYSDPQEFTGTSLRENYNSGTGLKAQGMSDTRLLENGKYFYDVGFEQYNQHHPYTSLSNVGARSEYNSGNYYSNSENVYDKFKADNLGGAYQNQDEFQNPELGNLP